MESIASNSTLSHAACRTDHKHVCSHHVQFYEDDDFLLDSLHTYLAEGLRDGEAAVVIVTPEHRRGLEERLARGGVDVKAARDSGLFTALDADAMLEAFMAGDVPERKQFGEVIGGVLSRASEVGTRPVRAFGEMVAILWAKGRQDAAIRLEDLWNELARVHSFTLLCAYPMRSFGTHADGEQFNRICQQHSRVIPAESFPRLGDRDDREREISRLQQKAAALEAEVEARRRAEDELNDLLENGEEGIQRVASDGRTLWANQALLNMLGYTRDEYIGRQISEFHADRAAFERAIEILMRGEPLLNYAARFRAKDGSIRDVIVNSNGRWERGELQYTRCFVRDVTEQKLAQEQRDSLLAREQATLRDLERSNEDLRDFAYAASHDLKEPLRGISNYASFLIEDELLSEQGRERVETIRRLAQRSYDLLDAILAFARVGRNGLDLDSIPLENLFGQAVENLRARIEDERAIVTFEPTELVVLCDPDLALQALTNLICNGLKYNVSSPKRLRIRGAVNQGGDLVISIEDNGIGIDARHFSRIFGMFKRLHSRDRYGGGTGAGLAIVERIVERHGGRIWVESRPGEGSTFSFTLAPECVSDGNL